MSIVIYTDGSAKGNPGNGGYGIVMKSGVYRKELKQGFRLTTNNRMELLAVIIALESIKKDQSEITIYSDSKYVVDSIEKKWVFSWEKKKSLSEILLMIQSSCSAINRASNCCKDSDSLLTATNEWIKFEGKNRKTLASAWMYFDNSPKFALKLFVQFSPVKS